MLGLSNQVSERLNTLFSLSHVVSITLPSTVNIDGTANEAQLTAVYDNVLTTMSKAFGGATLTDGNGAWYSDILGTIVQESVKVVQSYCSDMDDSTIVTMIDLAEMVKAQLSQESVLITLDGKAYLV